MNDLFKPVQLAPRDPILGLNEQFNSDNRTEKVNLGVGVYYDENGKIPLMQAVYKAELSYMEKAMPKGYLPIDGIASYNKAAAKLLLGSNSQVLSENRSVTVQTLGGTGALKIGADFLKQLLPNSKVLISNPSWENHKALFERAGFEVDNYPYYDPITHGLDFENMLSKLKNTAQKSIIVLHACCHNPTGIDPTKEQWRQIAEVIKDRNLIPFLDIAYQGFSNGLEEDAQVVRMFTEMDLLCFISSSFSKSFSLYGERVGALTVTTNEKDESIKVLSQIKRIIRTIYSNPPTHGATIVSSVLNSNELFKAWEEELSIMRQRIKLMRQTLVNKINEHGVKQDFSFVLDQKGMFSYSGLNKEQVENLKDKFAVYAVSSGRICVAALNNRNVDTVAYSIAQVINK
ncbi:amino acid aminotransferase [Candidatus Kinetoplastidibacterium crithidiae]|uniref:Aminotransferase n=1 Tax=Candidatus Kinetoplastidibacterium crithidiae TCC036E TaxID=1208918 RepID=M1M5V9_9PROT|nr:amino acid aminotransferase [Candidatus Kinetoplastibacterium crithidii]AFZ82812.1 aromatic amino acid aminotransferase [Candidatus Kinetoplastibacterium crithidii (ex Angomonas deanei ATCC 30255)]AGF47535.1 aromatic-amino-acid transaminase [Candidatus Kinetoplastibacterium crithidii TCC036E]EPY38217.1 aromatic amino acid aminotransferase [Angomonas deanei]EPY41518.1 aromatic-amino-acid transaminase [Angomonas deanei]|eukprot:EPY38217.1 aromatic amino acid aminotransferase [Angomonas deanei]